MKRSLPGTLQCHCFSSFSRAVGKRCQPDSTDLHTQDPSHFRGSQTVVHRTRHGGTVTQLSNQSNTRSNTISRICNSDAKALCSARFCRLSRTASNKPTSIRRTVRNLTTTSMYSDNNESSSVVDVHAGNPDSHVKRMSYVIALGSNLGDRMDWIEKACREMEAVDIHVRWTSSLWETKPMYVEDQAHFLNGVCVVETTLMPSDLLVHLQAIENKLGRVKVIEKGPRNIDLDILLWERGEYRNDFPDLTIPHKLMLEREFVLRPLCELLPTAQYPFMSEHLSTTGPSGPTYSKVLKKMAQNYWETRPSDRTPPMYTLTPLSPSLPAISPQHEDKKTHVMAILNLTPDSFSDGGKHAWNDREYLRTTILSHLNAGATVIDLGGQSSRPGAKDISPSEEIRRIMPALQILQDLRASPSTPPFAISIDTYRASVAKTAIQQGGADIINDISAGTLDPNMLPTVAELGCTYIMMHMRGTPATMTSDAHTTYSTNGETAISIIQNEMTRRLVAALEAGIRRWRIILDPGLGFAKTASQNLSLLRRLETLMSQSPARRHAEFRGGLGDIPWLVGASRKGFVRKVTGAKEPESRVMGTAAVVAACVGKGVDVVRVHDTREMVEVVRMSEAIYRGWRDPGEGTKKVEGVVEKNGGDEVSEFDVVRLDGVGVDVQRS